jgi:putative tryptophan/tyrosine transport system substrate-binding protein
MRRRELLALAAASLAWVGLPDYSQRAQRKKPLLVWYQSGGVFPNKFSNALLAGLADLGMAEGRDFDVDYRNANNQPEFIPALAAEVVGLQPDLIVTGSTDTALETKKLTSAIPIISAALADAVHLGLVESYAHPGGNVTGITPYLPDLPAKQMEIVRDIIPGAKKVGLLVT